MEPRRGLAVWAMGVLVTALATPASPRQIEHLDRGAIAVPANGGGMLVSWRLLATDPADIAFNVYRAGRKLNSRPVTDATNFDDAQGTTTAKYSVSVVLKRKEQRERASVQTWSEPYWSIPLQRPDGGTTPDGVTYTYSANDASVGDLDGDGHYEIVLKWDPSNSKDNAFAGYTGNVIVDAYTLDGRRLWRIDLGRNIRAGAHYTQFLVYDFDGDGKAEVVAKTADGTVDGEGKVIGDAQADWRSTAGEVPQADRTGAVTRADGTKIAPLAGRILRGPEYLTVFDGRTGRALATTNYIPPRDSSLSPTTEQLTQTWGDGYANRSDRFLAGVAYLDGQRPSIVMARGYYARTTLAAWDWRDGKLMQRWFFDSAKTADPEGFGGQGNHQLSVADVDGDGRDEIVYGSMAVDDDGRGLWTAKLYHGDALHVSDLDPTHPGLERFGVHESPRKNGGIGTSMLDARTGAVLWTTPGNNDVGRGVAFDIDPRYYGAECWATNSENLYDARGKVIGTQRPRQVNFGIWWDGDRLRELLDRNEISKWDWTTQTTKTLLLAEGVSANNGTKATPALSADLFGDWREEVIWRTADSSALRIYATPFPTTYRYITLMQDPQYRLAVAAQNVAYNQPPHPGFYLGEPPPK